MLDYERPDMLVGLGDYSGVDRNKIRIESFCTNVLRNETIDGLPKQEFDCFVPKEYDTAVFGIGHGMGNSRCNRWCYELTRHTMQQGYSTKLLFFHIPSAYPFTKAYTKIDILVTHIKEKDF